eukprot:TRINITY_DN7294_c0_g1_i1.p1 TRINITY_DN7294_c0_g1~~TRINITY_DN7294_c0_g1_i1.p1  ORF type:complete len:300 (-),score=33.86 TRINITY_DN7294_c0_g1_i1:206-1105(-)
MCIRDRYQRRVRGGAGDSTMSKTRSLVGVRESEENRQTIWKEHSMRQRWEHRMDVPSTPAASTEGRCAWSAHRGPYYMPSSSHTQQAQQTRARLDEIAKQLQLKPRTPKPRHTPTPDSHQRLQFDTACAGWTSAPAPTTQASQAFYQRSSAVYGSGATASGPSAGATSQHPDPEGVLEQPQAQSRAWQSRHSNCLGPSVPLVREDTKTFYEKSSAACGKGAWESALGRPQHASDGSFSTWHAGSERSRAPSVWSGSSSAGGTNGPQPRRNMMSSERNQNVAHVVHPAGPAPALFAHQRP